MGAARAARRVPFFRSAFLRISSIGVLFAAAAIAAGCAARRFERPAGPPLPAPEAAAAWESTTAACRGIQTAQAKLRLVFRSGGRRFPAVTLGAAFEGGGRAIALDARVGSASFFNLAGTAQQSTLVLRDGRYVRGAAADIVAALIDVRLEPARLLAILTGCLTPTPEFRQAVRRDAWLEVTTPDAVAYLEPRAGGTWRVRAGTFDDLVVDYVTGGPGAGQGPAWPRTIEIRATPAATRPAVSISISRLEITIPDTPLPASIFQVTTPPGATSMSLAELRASGPAGAAGN